MNKYSLALFLLNLLQSISASNDSVPTHSGVPGGITIYSNVHSVSNIFETMIPTLSYLYLEDK